MATPATTTRSTPLGIPMKDGFSTRIAFESDPDISFWEKTIQPPGVDGGDAIDTTTMHNVDYRTFRSRALTTLTEMTLTVAYYPDVYDEIQNIINEENDITVHFPDGSTLDFFGFLRLFEPQDHEEGSQPEASVTIQPTNWDPANNVEAGFVMTEIAGTSSIPE